MRQLFLLTIALVLPSLVGCGYPHGRVHGTVRYQGKPLTNATIIFLAPDNQAYPVRLGPDGSYQVASLPQGHLLVSIQADEPRVAPRPAPRPGKGADPVAAAQEQADDAGKQRHRPAVAANPAPTLPALYTDPKQSGLAVDLVGDDQEFSPDLK
jgi:hypothetical protein